MEEYVSAPNEQVFSNPIPRGGYRLVRSGHVVPACDIFPDLSAAPVRLVGNGFLMFPVGGYGYVVRNPEGDTPLFQRLMDCDPRVFSVRMQRRDFTDEDIQVQERILRLAGEVGPLVADTKKHSFRLDGSDEFPLESISLWEKEIADFRGIAAAHGAYEDRGKAVPGVPVATDFLKKKDGKTFFVLNDFAQEVDSLLSVKDMLYKGIVGFINHKLREYPVSVGYVADAKGVRAYQVASSLASHMWSMYAQGVFNDTPNGRETRRCVLCGRYQWISKVSRKTSGIHKGLFYCRNCANAYKQQKYRDRQSERKGRHTNVKKDRKRFLVEEF
jgi:hypothetical protein